MRLTCSHENIISKKLEQILLKYYQATDEGSAKLEIGHVVIIVKNTHDLEKQQDIMVSPLKMAIQIGLKSWLYSIISQRILFLNALSHKVITDKQSLKWIGTENLKGQNVTINRFDLIAHIFTLFRIPLNLHLINKQLTASVIGIA